ncbi:MAG: tRNA pseudouridine(55) synthase TruB [Mariprofundaceae bacterium]|nr:tRNA pseudouridine(55) synthase TruB [Mariprofundaceae bacterium]
MISGIVFLDKPEGWTSRKGVDEVAHLFAALLPVPAGRRRARVKAGHAGTLDPLATGMLPILLGEATRFADMGLQADKYYEVSIDLSLQTDTLDTEGVVTQRYEGEAITQDAITAALASWRGVQEQRPPHFSAIRIDGKRAYSLARQGIEPNMPLRAIHIHQLEQIDYDYPMLTLRVHCSKGTYIRSLARDIGADLGCGGCVRVLRRMATGEWSASMMLSWQQIQADPMQALQATAVWLRSWTSIDLDAAQAKRFTQGQRLAIISQQEEAVVVYAAQQLLGMGEVVSSGDHSVLRPKNVLPSAQKTWQP